MKLTKKTIINLQLFTGGEDDPGEIVTPPADAPSDPPADTPVDDPTPEKKFTQSELDTIIKDRLERAAKKAEAEKKQAEELAKLGESDRAAKLLEIKEKEFEDERNAFMLEKMELEVTKQMAEKGLPISFAKLLVTSEADSSMENINKFEKDWQAALEKAVTEKLKGTSPREGGTNPSGGSGLGKRLAKQRSESEVTVKENPYF